VGPLDREQKPKELAGGQLGLDEGHLVEVRPLPRRPHRRGLVDPGKANDYYPLPAQRPERR